MSHTAFTAVISGHVFGMTYLQPRHELITFVCLVLEFVLSTATVITSGAQGEREDELILDCNIGYNHTSTADHGYNTTKINVHYQSQTHSIVEHWYLLSLVTHGSVIALALLWFYWHNISCSRMKRALCQVRKVEEYLQNTMLTHGELVHCITHPFDTWNEIKEEAQLAVVNIRKAMFCRKTETLSPILLHTVINFVALFADISYVVGGSWIYHHAWTFCCDGNNELFNCTDEDIIVRWFFFLLVILIGFSALPRIYALYLSFPLLKEHWHCGQQLTGNCTEMFRQNMQDNKLTVLFSKSAIKPLDTEASKLLAVKPKEWLDKLREALDGLILHECDEQFQEFIQDVLGEDINCENDPHSQQDDESCSDASSAADVPGDRSSTHSSQQSLPEEQVLLISQDDEKPQPNRQNINENNNFGSEKQNNASNVIQERPGQPDAATFTEPISSVLSIVPPKSSEIGEKEAMSGKSSDGSSDSLAKIGPVDWRANSQCLSDGSSGSRSYKSALSIPGSDGEKFLPVMMDVEQELPTTHVVYKSSEMETRKGKCSGSSSSDSNEYAFVDCRPNSQSLSDGEDVMMNELQELSTGAGTRGWMGGIPIPYPTRKSKKNRALFVRAVTYKLHFP